jgi:hypothetical protein
MKRLLFVLLLLVIVDLPAAFAQPQEVESLRNRYFVVVWGYEGDGNAPRDSHTFATFYKGDDLAERRVRPATISWLSATAAVPMLGASEGRNFSLTETLAMACRDRKRVARWGPYETSFDLYQRALARIRLLTSGRVAYSALALRPGTMNCIKAAGDITDAPFNPGISWGFAASKATVRHFSPFFKNGERLNTTVARLTMTSLRCVAF